MLTKGVNRRALVVRFERIYLHYMLNCHVGLFVSGDNISLNGFAKISLLSLNFRYECEELI